jgi:hypothetical protein
MSVNGNASVHMNNRAGTDGGKNISMGNLNFHRWW